MIDYLILYEHKARELDNICLLKAELELRGYTVELYNIHQLKTLKYLTYKKPKVIVTSCLYDDVELNYYVYGTCGSIRKIVNLQWEQVLSEKWEKVNFHTPRNNAKYATHLCWGEACKNRLLENNVKNAIITGPMHMDFLRQEFIKFYKSKEEIIEEFNLNKNTKIVTYISSFTMANISNDDLEALNKRININFDDMQRMMITSKKETMKWIKNILKEDITFIYRPHPNEKSDKELKELEKEYKNFRVISDLSVKQWILISDKIFTWISTSVVECYFANKKCGILRPNKIEEFLDMVIYKNGDFISTYSEFLEKINNDFDEYPLDENLIKKHYEVTEKAAYINICDVLEDVYKSSEYDMPHGISIKSQLKHLMRGVIHTVIDKVNLLNKQKSCFFNNKYIAVLKTGYDKHKHDIVSIKEINDNTNKIKEILLNKGENK